MEEIYLLFQRFFAIVVKILIRNRIVVWRLLVPRYPYYFYPCFRRGKDLTTCWPLSPSRSTLNYHYYNIQSLPHQFFFFIL